MASDPQSNLLRIFIVDDSPLVVERLTMILNELQHVSVAGHAHTISTALVLIEEIKPDAVLLDIHLKDDAPSANGIDLLVILRKTYPAMRIIMLTNHANLFYINKCIKLGADYFFDKSNDFDKIPETLIKIYESNKSINPHYTHKLQK